jgi:hypothetical protein
MRPNKYTHGTGKRKIAILPMPPSANEWLVIMENDTLGSYPTAQEALEALVAGLTSIWRRSFHACSTHASGLGIIASMKLLLIEVISL